MALVDFRKLAKDNKHSGRETACKTKTISLENTFISERCNMELVDITCMYINIMLRQDKSRKRIASALKKKQQIIRRAQLFLPPQFVFVS